MTVRPIIMSAPMVRALLDGRKTQMRRLAWTIGDYPIPAGKVEYLYIGDGGFPVWRRPTIWQSVKPGDRLWVRETWRTHSMFDHLPPRDITARSLDYRADSHGERAGIWRPSIHMPRWASRLTLVVTAAHTEHLHAIGPYDARHEGMPGGGAGDYIKQFRELWQSLHTKHPWEDNPEVVALTFTVHQRNIDALERAA